MKHHRSILEGETGAIWRGLAWAGVVVFAVSGWVAVIVSIVIAMTRTAG